MPALTIAGEIDAIAGLREFRQHRGVRLLLKRSPFPFGISEQAAAWMVRIFG